MIDIRNTAQGVLHKPLDQMRRDLHECLTLINQTMQLQESAITVLQAPGDPGPELTGISDHGLQITF